MLKSSKQTPLQEEAHRSRCQKSPRSRFMYCHIFLFKNSYLFSNCNSENIKKILVDHGMSHRITCVRLHDYRRYKFCFIKCDWSFGTGIPDNCTPSFAKTFLHTTSQTLQIPWKFRKNLKLFTFQFNARSI